jgi:hypothetical protein
MEILRWGEAMREFHTATECSKKRSFMPRSSYSFSMSLYSFPTKAICLVALHIIEPAFVELNKGWFDDVQRHYVGKLYKLMEKLYLWSAAWTT